MLVVANVFLCLILMINFSSPCAAVLPGLSRFWMVLVSYRWSPVRRPGSFFCAFMLSATGSIIRKILEKKHVLSPTTWKILEGFCTGTLPNFVCYMYRNPPEPCLLSAPEPSGTSSAICTRTRRNLISHLRRNHLHRNHLHRNPPELCLLCVPEHSGTSSAITGTVSGTSSAICTGTRRNLVCYLHRNHPEPSGTSSAFCTGTLWNLISFLHRNPLELSGTLRNLLRNLGLQLHRIAPQLFWAKDPIASFAVGELIVYGNVPPSIKVVQKCAMETHGYTQILMFNAWAFSKGCLERCFWNLGSKALNLKGSSAHLQASTSVPNTQLASEALLAPGHQEKLTSMTASISMRP